MSRTPVRISFRAVLRVRAGDRIGVAPGGCAPPGGVIEHFPPAESVLAGFGFVGDGGRGLSGVLPGGSLRRFLTWFGSGAYREAAEDCLRRVAGPAEFAHVRTVVDDVVAPGGRRVRRYEVCELVAGEADVAFASAAAVREAGYAFLVDR
ncbi:hypothetical protein [Actinosynnema sp. NPDC020468]|uniref:hypothetical protein n=1 Tax=Actinosynnema sp. NPDC020468 TaxID=3154488 RepID=UPI0033E0E6A5